MKKLKNHPILISLIVTVSACAGTAFGQATFDLNSLTYYGTGPDRAAFVIDWNNGSANEIVAWGYRFDDSVAVTMEEMMAEIASDVNSELFIRWDSDAGFGAFLFGLGKQNGATTFDVSGAVDALGNPVTANFVNGVWDIDTGVGWEPPAAFGGTASNAGDFYAEGFGWSSYVAGSAPDFNTSVSEQRITSPADWTATDLGISGIELVNEGWYGLGNGREPSTVPEPAWFGIYFSLAAVFVALRRSGR